MTHHADAATIARGVTLILLAVCGGTMTRFYITRPHTMPWVAFIGFGFFLAGAMAVTIGNFGLGWRWFESPLFAGGALVCTVGAARHLTWRRPR